MVKVSLAEIEEVTRAALVAHGAEAWIAGEVARAVRVADRVQRVVRAPAEAPVVRVRLARVDPRAQEQVDQKVAIAERLAKLEPPEPAAIQGFAMAEVVAMDRPVGR